MRDEQFISRIYDFVISNIKETYPYCHGDWALGNIIIDDKASTVKAWNDAGGIGILHTPGGSASTIRQLRDLGI